MTRAKTTLPWFNVALASIAMAYGWGYRGIVGHEGGAMIPGAMLGLAVCMASRREDWQRRAMVAGLFGAAGFSWGGSLSYMEQTMYVQSDSWPDVLYGFTMLFFLGALWAGIAGAILGMAFTLRRSQLESLARVFASLCAVYLAFYLYFLFDPATKEAYEQLTVDQFHDGEWLAALIAVVVSAVHWAARKSDRSAAALFFQAAIAWWIGYLGFTKFGGLLLAPAFRSESWGGVVGILTALIVHLARTRNGAALLLCRYGLFGGGIGFVVAVLVRHPMVVEWGIFGQLPNKLPHWKIAEETFGLVMGIALALGVARLERGALVPAEEDAPRKRLDLFGAFVMLVALMWVNLRRAPMDWLNRYKAVLPTPEFGIAPWIWFALGGAVLSAMVLYVLYLHAYDRLDMVPRSAHGKAALVFVALTWPTVIAGFIQTFPTYRDASGFVCDASLLLLAVIATMLALTPRKPIALPPSVRLSSDPCWNPRKTTLLLCACMPLFVFAVTATAKSMQDGPTDGARLRFGPNAFWIKQSAMIGTWIPVGITGDLQASALEPASVELKSITFLPSRSVVVTRRDGTEIADLHRWHYMNSLTHLDWNARANDEASHVTVPLTLRGSRMFIHWPVEKSEGKFLVLEHAP